MSETKKWRLKTKNGKVLDFRPRFISNIKGDTLCDLVTIKEGNNEFIVNFLDLVLFCYFVGDEEVRRKLTNIQTKTVREIPYNVTFKISDNEKKSGIAKRRIILTIDELISAYCRNEAQKFVLRKKLQHKT